MAQLYAFLGGYALRRDIGAQYEYSNLGGGLLGHVLGLRAKKDYQTLVRQRIAGPLHMADTTIDLSPAQRARLAKGHTATLEPAANWDLPALAGAGGLRSDARDILNLLAAELGYADSPLTAAMKAQYTVVRRPAGGPGMDVALGWHILKAKGGEIVWHNGGTGGYRTFMGFDPARGVGVVVLTNAATQAGGDDIGFHLLTGSPLAPPPPVKLRQAIALEPTALQAFVGRYQFTPQVFMTVTRDGGRLFEQVTGQGAFEIYPETATDFFLKVIDAQISFQPGPDGQASGLVLHQGGRDVPAKRVADAPP